MSERNIGNPQIGHRRFPAGGSVGLKLCGCGMCAPSANDACPGDAVSARQYENPRFVACLLGTGHNQ
jgi:hypothetical protein